MKQWFEQLSSQEKVLLIVAAGILFLFLIYMLGLRPIEQKSSSLKKEIAEKQEALNWMRNASVEVRALQSTSQSKPKDDTRTLIARVSAELKQKGLEPTAIQPEGEKRLRLTLKAVPFSVLMERLDSLQSEYNVIATQAVIEPAEGTGKVDARLTLSR